MLLIPMDGPESIPCTAQCLSCGARKNSSLLYADIEGEPYKAFYCRDTADCVPTNATVMTREQFFAMKEGGKP